MLQPVVDVRPVWPWVREGLAKIVRKTRDDWMPEDVFHEIKTGVSFLYLIYDGDERIGFLILQKWGLYHDGPRLFVRALWVEPRKLVAHHDAFYAELTTLARQHGCVAMRMASNRRWELDGWIPKQTIYEMAV